LTEDPFPYGFFPAYLNKPEVQAAIGAFTNYSASSEAVYQAFTATGDDNREVGTIAALKKLIQQDITVMLYAGDADYMFVFLSQNAAFSNKRSCNWLGVEVVAAEVQAEGFDCAGYVNLTTSDDIIHGQVKQAGSFSFVRIYESGHEVPFYQPIAALEIFDRAINGLDIATGTVKTDRNYLTEGTKTSTYRQGNGTMQYEVLPANATYNYTLNGPNPTKVKREDAIMGKAELVKRSGMVSARKRFKPHGKHVWK
jgi:hypothetical protein